MPRKVGRPTKFTPQNIAKLEEAFSMGCSDLEACLYSGICKTALYNYQEKHPEFVERKQLLKENPVLLARSEVLKGMKDNPELSLKYLERKKKDEFSLRTESRLEGKIEGIKVFIPEEEE